MNRRKFIQTSCTACVSATALVGILSSCKATKYISGKLGADGLFVNTDEFKVSKKGVAGFLPFIIVRNDALQYRFVYIALTIQNIVPYGCNVLTRERSYRLQANFCSVLRMAVDFGNNGKITNGPADRDLRAFPVTVTKNELFIDLRKV
jgi:hypothetical protein